ncbi:hypothetical protein FKM82_019279 [Ascaphus truei]
MQARPSPLQPRPHLHSPPSPLQAPPLPGARRTVNPHAPVCSEPPVLPGSAGSGRGHPAEGRGGGEEEAAAAAAGEETQKLEVSKADCYVQLRLPTASPLASRTGVVYNCSDPEWNETFHYRIHGAIKNILELTLYDRDVMLDDQLSSVVFDVGNIKPGRITKRVFQLNPKEKEVLEVEFSIEER